VRAYQSLRARYLLLKMAPIRFVERSISPFPVKIAQQIVFELSDADAEACNQHRSLHQRLPVQLDSVRRSLPSGYLQQGKDRRIHLWLLCCD